MRVALVLFCAVTAIGQTSSDVEFPKKPEPVRAVLESITQSVRRLQSIVSKDQVSELATIDGNITTWLQNRLKEDDPEDYRLSLTFDAFLLKYAESHRDAANEIVKAVAEDLNIKTNDCLTFGHGRSVPVEIETLRNGKPEAGWQIVYLWIPSKQVAVREMTFPSPSSPAAMELPAGMYSIKARKTINNADTVTPAQNLPVGGRSKINFKIALP